MNSFTLIDLWHFTAIILIWILGFIFDLIYEAYEKLHIGRDKRLFRLRLINRIIWMILVAFIWLSWFSSW